MKKRYSWFVLLIMSLLLVACNENEETVAEPEEEVEEVEPEVEPMSDEEIKEIVVNNLDQMEASQDDRDYELTMQIVQEDIIDPAQDTEEVTELVEMTKEKVKNLVAEEIMDEWTREYLSIYYWTMHPYHLNAGDIEARFEVVDQTEDSFEVSFLTLEDEAGFNLGGTYHLYYVKENDHWVYLDVEFIPAEEKPLDLTFADLDEYFENMDVRTQKDGIESNYEQVEEVEVNGVTYLVFKAYDRYAAVSTVDSTYHYEVAGPYNE